MAKTKLAVGTILRGNGLDKVDPEIEKALEERRPEDKISRRDGVFSLPVPDFTFLGLEGGYIHRVEVSPILQIHNTFWIGKLQMSRLKQKQGWNQSSQLAWTPALLDELCDNYWSGRASNKSVWECLTLEAVVTELMSENYIPVGETAGGWHPKP